MDAPKPSSEAAHATQCHNVSFSDIAPPNRGDVRLEPVRAARVPLAGRAGPRGLQLRRPERREGVQTRVQDRK